MITIYVYLASDDVRMVVGGNVHLVSLLANSLARLFSETFQLFNSYTPIARHETAKHA